jgi:protein-S-isoprenylcysteine O-methyltransferase Ste14
MPLAENTMTPAKPMTDVLATDWGALLVNVVARAMTVLLMSVFVYAAMGQWLAAPHRITLMLMVISELTAVGVSLVSRSPQKRDWTPTTFVCTVAATYYFLAVWLAPGIHLVPEAVGTTLQVVGLGWQIFAKLSLRRSFGLLPANRGIVSSGAYRFMRHPIYLGYCIADIGFLLANFGLQNLLVYGGLFALQAYRILREEKLLSADEAYRTYKGKVRYRVIPGLF